MLDAILTPNKLFDLYASICGKLIYIIGLGVQSLNLLVWGGDPWGLGKVLLAGSGYLGFAKKSRVPLVSIFMMPHPLPTVCIYVLGCYATSANRQRLIEIPL